MELKKMLRSSRITLLAALALGCVNTAWSETFQVEVTNLTIGQTFTPRIAVTHSAGRIFELGKPAHDVVTAIAEGGDVAPLQALLATNEVAGFITDTMVSEGGLLEPGKTETFTIQGNAGDKLTILNMLIPTNDGFIGINAVNLPSTGYVTYSGVVYDAGVETNDESCANIPGPVCDGAAASESDAGEGFIHVHPGIHGIADLSAAKRDWRNPAVQVVVTKM